MKTLSRYLTVLALLATLGVTNRAIAGINVISFGGEHGLNYAPNNLLLAVGDIIIFEGDFAAMPLHFDEVPPGSIHPADVTSGDRFMFTIHKGGIYRYSSPAGGFSGMFGAMSETISVEDANDASHLALSVWPNPALNTQTVRVELGFDAALIDHLTIVGMDGRVVIANSALVAGNSHQIELELDPSTFSPGAYLLRIHARGATYTRKLMLVR